MEVNVNDPLRIRSDELDKWDPLPLSFIIFIQSKYSVCVCYNVARNEDWNDSDVQVTTQVRKIKGRREGRETIQIGWGTSSMWE